MLKRISARLIVLAMLLTLTTVSGCASTSNSGWFDGGSLFSSMSWGGAPGGQSEPDLVYDNVTFEQSEPE